MIKTDCFAWDSVKKECKALKKVYCKDGDCNFFKTKKQYSVDLKRAEKHNEKYGIEQRGLI